VDLVSTFARKSPLRDQSTYIGATSTNPVQYDLSNGDTATRFDYLRVAGWGVVLVALVLGVLVGGTSGLVGVTLGGVFVLVVKLMIPGGVLGAIAKGDEALPELAMVGAKAMAG
jgi:hypothetical protein